MSGLKGKQVVITRAEHQAGEFATLLRQYGAIPVVYPCIAIVPPEDTGELDDALRRAADGDYDWLLLTSPNTVLVLAERKARLGIDLKCVQAGAVGSQTAQLARDLLRIVIAKTAETHTAEGLLAVLGDVSGKRILLPQSAIARPTLEEGLAQAGAFVDSVAAYTTIMGQGGDPVPELLALKQIDAVTFTSSSTVTNFLRRLETENGAMDLLEGVCLAAIGPITARTMRENGLYHNVLPDSFTLPAMVATLNDYFDEVKS